MGLYTLGQALCYAELGSIIPKTGGDYTYIYEILGPLPGFLAVWGHVFICVTSADAALGLTAALYLLKPFALHCNNVTLTLLSAVFIGEYLGRDSSLDGGSEIASTTHKRQVCIQNKRTH